MNPNKMLYRNLDMNVGPGRLAKSSADTSFI